MVSKSKQIEHEQLDNPLLGFLDMVIPQSLSEVAKPRNDIVDSLFPDIASNELINFEIKPLQTVAETQKMIDDEQHKTKEQEFDDIMASLFLGDLPIDTKSDYFQMTEIRPLSILINEQREEIMMDL